MQNARVEYNIIIDGKWCESRRLQRCALWYTVVRALLWVRYGRTYSALPQMKMVCAQNKNIRVKFVFRI